MPAKSTQHVKDTLITHFEAGPQVGSYASYLTSGGYASPSTSPTRFPLLLSVETDVAEEISKLKPGNGFYILVS